MEIIKELNDKTLVLRLNGRLDTNTSSSLELLSNELDDITKLILDFNKLEYVSSAGLRVLLSFQKIMNNKGSMELINVNSDIYEILEMTGFTSILNIR